MCPLFAGDVVLGSEEEISVDGSAVESGENVKRQSELENCTLCCYGASTVNLKEKSNSTYDGLQWKGEILVGEIDAS